MDIKKRLDKIINERKKIQIKDLEKLEKLLIETIWECDNFDDIRNTYSALCATHEKLLELKS